MQCLPVHTPLPLANTLSRHSCQQTAPIGVGKPTLSLIRHNHWSHGLWTVARQKLMAACLWPKGRGIMGRPLGCSAIPVQPFCPRVRASCWLCTSVSCLSWHTAHQGRQRVKPKFASHLSLASLVPRLAWERGWSLAEQAWSLIVLVLDPNQL